MSDGVRARTAPGAWLDAMDDAEIYVCLMHLGAWNPAASYFPTTRELALSLLKSTHGWCKKLNKVRKTNLFRDRVAQWQALQARGDEPTRADLFKSLPSKKTSAYLDALGHDELKMLCVMMGLCIDGSTPELEARIKNDKDHIKFFKHVGTKPWCARMEKRFEVFSRYVPNDAPVEQVAFSHVPTTDVRRDEFLDTKAYV